ncbi:hypothetical protein HI914_02963 [Erysiphe necator]|nr:hypothetical protein HI914_02963 [Erysiphe necator]
MAGVEAGATQAIGKNAVQTSENGKIHSSQVAIEKIGDVLKKMKGCLNKVGLKGVIMTVEEVDEAIEALNNNRFIWLHATQNNSLEHRMLALEEAVKKNLVEKCGQMGSKGVVGKSYASVVAPPAAKAAVRIRVPGAEELQPAELLSIAKQKIKGAYAIRQMRSHDTEVFVQSSNHRDAALSMEQPKEFKILRKDFPVEIAGVPLSTKIASGKNADNTALISSLTNASKVRIPGLQINRIRWLQDGKEHEKARKKGHTRGSVILSLPTEELQWRVVRNGIVIDSILYSAQIWTPKAQTKQCFNCSQWGHVQAVCSKLVRCGECAGQHQSRDCPKDRILCCNCEQNYRSWQRAVCKTFKVYQEGVERARLENQIKTAEIRSEKIPATEAKYVPVNSSDEKGFTLVTRKSSETKRGPGRPRKDALAPMTSQIIATSPNAKVGIPPRSPRLSNMRANVENIVASTPAPFFT